LEHNLSKEIQQQELLEALIERDYTQYQEN
jgi:hypothetical protein